MAKYEKELENKCGRNKQLYEPCLQKSKINFSNFLFYHYLKCSKFRQAITHYQDEIFNKQENRDDVTQIILLFFPYIIKSNYFRLTFSQNQMSHFKWQELKFKNVSNDKLENTIKMFFKNYSELESKKFMFHKLEMFNYLECFLTLYTEKELDRMTKEEENKFTLFHYFRPFIRPEDYFTINAREQENENEKE